MGNTTYYFGDMVRELNTSILMIAVIALLEAVAIAKAFGNYFISSKELMFYSGLNQFYSEWKNGERYSRDARPRTL
jgi:hypothetical protein